MDIDLNKRTCDLETCPDDEHICGFPNHYHVNGFPSGCFACDPRALIQEEDVYNAWGLNGNGRPLGT